MNLSHFAAASLYALFASIVFGITQRNTPREMLRYGLQCFGVFVGGLFVAGWVMYLLPLLHR
jgi:hypothetical protein